ncbi:MAG: Hsp20/alpha crystallin family protein [Anaerolineae bacterium]|nr:Hsp20/alpha crystallin family protein [Anaerolineae bacterium]
MSLVRWNPYDPFDEMDQTMNRMMERMRSMMRLPGNGETGHLDANSLAVDMTSDEHNIIVHTAIPGFKEDEVSIDVRGNVLTITAESKHESEREDKEAHWHIREMRYGRFARSLTLPDEVKADKAEASLENGVLTVTLPKQKESHAQKIAVKARELLTGGKK